MYASQRHMLPEPTRPKFNVRQPRGPPKPRNMDKMQLTIQKWTDDKVQQGSGTRRSRQSYHTPPHASYINFLYINTVLSYTKTHGSNYNTIETRHSKCGMKCVNSCLNRAKHQTFLVGFEPQLLRRTL